jgi:hypothetical protein
MNKLLSKIKAFFKKQPPIQEYFSVLGYHFKVLDPVSMPFIRQSAIISADYAREWGIDKSDLIAYDNMILKQCEFPAQWDDDQHLVSIMDEKMRNIANLLETKLMLIQEDFQYKPFLRTASHMIIIEGEKPEEIDHKFYSKKMELCQAHPEIELFFCRIAWSFHNRLSDSNDTSKMWEYYPAKAIKVMENKMYKEINSTIYSTGL